MKYTLKQQKQVNRINSVITKISLLIDKKRAKIQSIESEISSLHGKSFLEGQKISRIDAKIRKNCKHTGSKHRSRCYRDDANHNWHIFCDDCGEQVGSE